MLNIILLNIPNLFNNPSITKEMKPIITKLSIFMIETITTVCNFPSNGSFLTFVLECQNKIH